MNSNNDVNLVVWGCIGGIFAILITAVVGALFNGYVIMKFWGWFILPVFESMPEIGLVEAIGIALVMSVLTHQVQPSKEKDGETSISGTVAVYVGKATLAPLFMLIIGYIVQSFL
jgi:hypothetical protein